MNVKNRTAVTTRFAPSPTGFLHLGHAYAAMIAHDCARQSDGQFLVRIEDIDAARCRAEFSAAILEDLAWLGLHWDLPVRRQSDHLADYHEAVARLMKLGVLYPCFCSRREIAEELARMPSAPHGPEGPHYPGTCKELAEDFRRQRIAAGEPYSLRLSISDAAARLPSDPPLTFVNLQGDRTPAAETITVSPELFGDVVIARKDVGVSYHLAVTVDDALQNVSLVTRGEDLLPATHVQRLIQTLRGLPEPRYLHHRLILHESGRRLAKRDQDATLRALRARGETPDTIRSRFGLTNP